jgi:hypothetical protein
MILFQIFAGLVNTSDVEYIEQNEAILCDCVPVGLNGTRVECVCLIGQSNFVRSNNQSMLTCACGSVVKLFTDGRLPLNLAALMSQCILMISKSAADKVARHQEPT